jgi:hypothetical protein
VVLENTVIGNVVIELWWYVCIVEGSRATAISPTDSTPRS